MGLIQAAIGAIAGTLADQWIDFFTVPPGISQTAAVFPALPVGQNSGRGSNIRGSKGIITNGSKLIVPEGYTLMTFQDGMLTSIVTTPGGYIWDSDSEESKSIFTGSDLTSTLTRESWERFKYGGSTRTQQKAFFVSSKELPNNKFGTQTPIYWDDAYLNAQVGATARGTYSIKIIDPIKFVKCFLPASTLQNDEVFDFADYSNDFSNQLFSEVVASLASALSLYANQGNQANRISRMQANTADFSIYLSQAVQDAFHWEEDRGLIMTKAALIGIDYDPSSRELITSAQRADALSGPRGDSNLKASIASGLEGAGKNSGASGLIGLGLAAGGIGLGTSAPSSFSLDNKQETQSSASDDLIAKLKKLKEAFDLGLISESEYTDAKNKVLGL